MAKRIIIAAQSTNRVIGKNNALPWHLPEDFKFFKQTTSHHAIIMGRNTFHSLPKLLPNRAHLVLSQDANLSLEGAQVFTQLESALHYADQHHSKAFIIGGAQLYAYAMAHAKALHIEELLISWIDATIEGDSYFPIIDQNIWRLQQEQRFEQDERHAHAITFRRYTHSQFLNKERL